MLVLLWFLIISARFVFPRLQVLMNLATGNDEVRGRLF